MNDQNVQEATQETKAEETQPKPREQPDVDITICPQCLNKTKKSTKKTWTFYRCHDCKYYFKFDGLQMKIAFEDGKVEKERIVAYSSILSVGNKNGKVVYQGAQIDEANYQIKPGELFCQWQKYNPSYWGYSKSDFKLLEDDFTKEEFYHIFCNWFNNDSGSVQS